MITRNMGNSELNQNQEAVKTEQSASLKKLRETLERLRNQPVAEFAATLDERKRQEREWANFSRDKHHLAEREQTEEEKRPNYKYYSTTQLINEYRDSWVASKVPGKVFLDYACGAGQNALSAARAGASLSIGIDISNRSIDNATEESINLGLSDRCFFLTGDCENTGLPDESIDVILCTYMLHHLDLQYAYPELHRILKKGGCILCCESLNYNPAMKLYRKFTPEMRTEWEKDHILSLKEVRLAKRYSFNVGKIRYWHLFSILGTPVRNIPPLFKMVMPVLHGIDRIVLSIPGLQLMSWFFTFELRKPAD